jgi:hypothetical protein
VEAQGVEVKKPSKIPCKEKSGALRLKVATRELPEGEVQSIDKLPPVRTTESALAVRAPQTHIAAAATVNKTTLPTARRAPTSNTLRDIIPPS